MKTQRLEYKYLIPLNKIDDLRNAIKPFVYPDEYADREKNKEYTVHSIYLDSIKLDDYYDKLAGIKIRKKLRIRGYNFQSHDSIVFLEVKRKHENHISKNRAPLYFKDLPAILETANCEQYILKKKNYLDSINDARKFFYLCKIKNCSPVVLINYEREAFFSKHDSTLRITFDKNLRSRSFPAIKNLFDDSGMKYGTPGNFILEIKFFNGFPTWLQKIISKFGLNRQAVSKYTISIDSNRELKKFVDNRKLILPSIFNDYNKQIMKEEIKNVE